MSATARMDRLLRETVPDVFTSALPELDRCDRLSTAWDDMADALSARNYNDFDSARDRFVGVAREVW